MEAGVKYNVKGSLEISYFTSVDVLVEASSEEEAVLKAAEEQKEIVEADPEHYLYEMKWDGDSPMAKEAS